MAVLLLAASAAHAECPVRVADAPEDVRVAIEGWAHREQVCGPPLEVRVVPTPQGLHLWARDPLGRTRERTVPDADSVAVLVASWMADDSISSPPPIAENPTSHVEVDPETGALRDDRDRPALPARVEVNHTVAGAPALTFGATMGRDGMGDTKAVRVEVELARVGRWTFGAFASMGQGNMTTLFPGYPWESETTTTYRAMASVGPTFWFGGWSFRPAIAAGVANQTTSAGGVTNRAYEVSLSLARHVAGAWSVVVEPVYFITPDPSQMTDTHYNVSYTQTNWARPVEIDVMLGLRRGL